MSKKVMQQALEALEMIESCDAFIPSIKRQSQDEAEHDETRRESVYGEVARSITALRAALAEPEQPVELTDWDIDRVTDQQWTQHNDKTIYAAHRAFARAVIAAYEAKQGEQT